MKKVTALALAVSAFFAAALPASAQVSGNICPVKPTTASAFNFSELCNLIIGNNSNVVGNILNIAFIVAVILALAFLIFGGIKWITSGGDKAKVEAARNTLVAALIGLVLVFLSFFILQLIFALFGIDFQSGNFWAQLNVFQ